MKSAKNGDKYFSVFCAENLKGVVMIEKKEEYASAEMNVVELEQHDILTAKGSKDIILPDIPIPLHFG